MIFPPQASENKTKGRTHPLRHVFEFLVFRTSCSDTSCDVTQKFVVHPEKVMSTRTETVSLLHTKEEEEERGGGRERKKAR